MKSLIYLVKFFLLLLVQVLIWSMIKWGIGIYALIKILYFYLSGINFVFIFRGEQIPQRNAYRKTYDCNNNSVLDHIWPNIDAWHKWSRHSKYRKKNKNIKAQCFHKVITWHKKNRIRRLTHAEYFSRCRFGTFYWSHSNKILQFQ